MNLPQEDHVKPDFSVTELLARVDDDRDLLHEILNLFKQDAPRHIANLQRAVASLDAASVASEAHTLKGMLLNLSAQRAATSAAALEIRAREGKITEFAASFAVFQQHMHQVILEITACLSGVAS